MAALAFLEQRIDTQVSTGMMSIPTVPGRTMRYTQTGYLTQNYTAAFPKHKFDMAPVIKTAAAFQSVLDIWYVVHFGGPYRGFLVRDWRDYKLTQSNSRLTLISGSNYQINRVHSYGGVEFVRPIYKPEAGVVIKRTRASVVSTATAVVTTTSGQVAVSGHVSGDTYTCEGLFNMPVTFSEDQWDAELRPGAEGILAVSGSIKLEECPP